MSIFFIEFRTRIPGRPSVIKVFWMTKDVEANIRNLPDKVRRTIQIRDPGL
jgi:hypothetical protein